MRQVLLLNAAAILSQNATEVYYKMGQILLKNAAVLLQNATVITKSDDNFNNTYINYKW